MAKDTNERGVCVQNDNRNCYGELFLFHFLPGCISSSEIFHWIEKRLTEAEKKGKPIRRLVFWDLAQLQERFPLLAADPMFLPSLIDYLKNSKRSDTGAYRNITSLFMGAPNTLLGRAASAIADNVIFTWRDVAIPRIKFAQVVLDDRSNDTELPTNHKGVAIYVNRIEGQPGMNPLFFIPDVNTKNGNEVQYLDSKRSVPVMPLIRIKDERNLRDAEEKIRSIWALQDLPNGQSFWRDTRPRGRIANIPSTPYILV